MTVTEMNRNTHEMRGTGRKGTLSPEGRDCDRKEEKNRHKLTICTRVALESERRDEREKRERVNA